MPLKASLISWWDLEEATGATRNDSHGSNNLADNASVLQTDGKVGKCADFTAASSQYLNIADNASLSVDDIDFSFAFWAFKVGAATQGCIGKVTTWANAVEYYIYFDASRFRFRVSNGVAGASVVADNFGAPSDSTWYFIFAYHDSVANEIGISVNDGTPNTTSYSGGSYDSA